MPRLSKLLLVRVAAAILRVAMACIIFVTGTMLNAVVGDAVDVSDIQSARAKSRALHEHKEERSQSDYEGHQG